jgi:ABC-type multidrug transport system ATPase subunit
MPYKIVKSGSKFKVMKKSGSKHVFGTHPSKKAAQKQIAAIHANESVLPKLTFEQYVANVLNSLN